MSTSPQPNTPEWSRRRLLTALAVFAPAAVASRRRARAAAQDLDHAALEALGAVVLPAELGRAGVGPVVRGFERWLAGYRGGAELLHPYGSAELGRTPPSPAVRWKAQLAALGAAARARRGRSFPELSPADRRALVAEALADAKAAIPAPAAAHHVALGLLAYWVETPAAADLARGARIGKLGCRPLAASGEKPASEGTGDR